jgi:putative transposase
VNGRKRHVAVDKLGLILALVVHAANVQDKTGARMVLWELAARGFRRLATVFADGGYESRPLADLARRWGGWAFVVVQRLGGTTGFVVLPKRWVVERTFAWVGRNRLAAREYEERTDSSEAVVYAAMVRLMLRRLARAKPGG